METKNSAVNRALGDVIRGALRTERVTIAAATKATGISPATLNRMISEEPRDINITQLVLLARVLNTTAEALVKAAEERAARVSSAAGSNVTQLPTRPDTVADFETYAGDRAAHSRDPDSDQPE